MNYYPTDKCFICAGEMQSYPQLFLACKKICGYRIYPGKMAILLFEVDSCWYEVHIQYSYSYAKSITTIHKYEIGNDLIYQQNTAMELSMEEWKEFIQRIEKTQIFK